MRNRTTTTIAPYVSELRLDMARKQQGVTTLPSGVDGIESLFKTGGAGRVA
jgi:hypothetical protein